MNYMRIYINAKSALRTGRNLNVMLTKYRLKKRGRSNSIHRLSQMAANNAFNTDSQKRRFAPLLLAG